MYKAPDKLLKQEIFSSSIWWQFKRFVASFLNLTSLKPQKASAFYFHVILCVVCSPLPWCCNHHQRSSQTLISFQGPSMISQKPVRLVHCMLFCIKWSQAVQVGLGTFRAFLSSLMMQSPEQQEFWNVSVWSQTGGATWELIGKSYPGPRSSSSSWRKSAQFCLRRALSVCMIIWQKLLSTRVQLVSVSRTDGSTSTQYVAVSIFCNIWDICLQ